MTLPDLKEGASSRDFLDSEGQHRGALAFAGTSIGWRGACAAAGRWSSAIDFNTELPSQFN